MNTPTSTKKIKTALVMATIDRDLVVQTATDKWFELFGNIDFLQQDVSSTALQTIEQRLRHCFETGHVEPFSLLQERYICEPWLQQQDSDNPLLNLVFLDQSNDDLDRELSRLKSEHELILGAAGEGIYGLDLEGRTTFANAAAIRILGWTADEILGTPLHDIHHHSYPDGSPYPRQQCPIYAAFNDGEVHRVDNEVFWCQDGSSIPVEYISTPIIVDNEIQGAVVLFRDISERQANERQREHDFKEISRLKKELELERDFLRDELNVNSDFGEIIGNSPALQHTLAQIEAVADTPSSVLILGESGVGKEMIARAIHNKSSRASEALVKVNCASIPKELFESEFFGHVKGSFTGAHRDRIGRLQLANGGTLFLDEVGEIPIDLQGKLLRALQEQEFERVGDERTIKVNVRIVAATNRDLKQEIALGNFREDLYYRLSVFPVSVPPLRDRPQDVPLLAQHFLQQGALELGRERLSLSNNQANMLSQHQWPGNIRELKNVIERALILSKNQRLRLDLAMPEMAEELETNDIKESIADGEFLTEEQFRLFERANLIKALEQASWKISGEQGAAKLMGIKASTLSYRMGILDIKKPA